MAHLAERALIGFAGLLFFACGGNSYEESDSSAEGGTSGTATGGATSGGVAGAGAGGTSGGGAGPTAGAGPSAGAGPMGPSGGAGPSGDASCTLSHPTSDVTTEVNWNAETGTFRIGSTYWRLDSNLWVVSKSDDSGQWAHSMGYDELGTMNWFAYYWEGAENPINSWDQTNEYEDGLLVSFSRIYRSGDRRTSQTREYSGGLLARWTNEEMNPETHTSTAEFAREGELVSAVTYEAEGRVMMTFTATYDRGHLTVLDMDGVGFFSTADGTPDVRQSWEYDEAGRIIRFEQDGTTALDNPYIDGVPDETILFEPACAEIAVFPEELYRLPFWLAPRPGSGTGF